MKRSHFLKTALKDYKVGAVMESSRYTVQKIVSFLKPEHKFIIEYGAGNGTITKKLLQRLPEASQIIAIESNENFINELSKITDPRIKIVCGDVVVFLRNFLPTESAQIDAVISGIPFSFLKPALREEIVHRTHDLLSDRGMLLVYQHSVLILPLLKKYFAKTKVFFEPRNILPYFIMRAEK